MRLNPCVTIYQKCSALYERILSTHLKLTIGDPVNIKSDYDNFVENLNYELEN